MNCYLKQCLIPLSHEVSLHSRRPLAAIFTCEMRHCLILFLQINIQKFWLLFLYYMQVSYGRTCIKKVQIYFPSVRYKNKYTRQTQKMTFFYSSVLGKIFLAISFILFFSPVIHTVTPETSFVSVTIVVSNQS